MALRRLPAVETLRQTWVEQFYREGEKGETVRLREVNEMPPAAQMIHSPYDPQVRYSTKGDISWTGYKVVLTETCDADAPHLIPHVTTAPATDQDMEHTADIHADLSSKGMLPSQHLVDSRFIDAGLLVSSQKDYEIDLVGPLPRNGNWQAKAGQGFSLSSFQVDFAARKATCPHNMQSRYWQLSHDDGGNDVIRIGFASRTRSLPSRPLCTRAKNGRRSLVVRPQAQYEALQQARKRQNSAAFAEQ
jgi:transposase